MERVVNWTLLSNPANWVIVFLVLYLSAVIAHLLYTSATSEGGSPIKLPAGL